MPGGTVVYAHLIGVPKEDVPGLHVDMNLIDATGAPVARLSGRWGDGPGREQIEWRFARTTGSVTLRFELLVAPPPTADALVVGVDPVTGTSSTEVPAAEAFRARLVATALRLQAWLANAVPVQWTLVLPD